MSSIQKTAKGYRVQVQVKGQRDSATFETKKEAQLWAARMEIQFQTVAKGQAGTITTTHQVFERYRVEVSVKHKGERWECVRLLKMQREFPNIMLSNVTVDHIIKWRNARLKEVKEASVRREMGLLSAVFEKCAGVEWRYLAKNPCKGVDRPPESPHRTRTMSWSEIKKMLRTLGYPKLALPRNAVGHALLLALRTGMRQGELANIEWANVHPKFIHTDSKSMVEFTRDVPLSRQAKRLVEKMRGYHPTSMFAVSAGSIDTHFRNARARAGLSGFTFHDSRHTAATWIGRKGKLSLIEMCKAFGWKDPKHALIYFNPTGDDLADKM